MTIQQHPAPAFSPDDTRWMQRALDLARQGIGLTAPNPMVGCVIVHNGNVVGEGFHRYEERDHAEVIALRQAGAQARGATAYVTLEPCSHTGRTPPCCDALIAAGVGRVIAATLDPNPAVHGNGMKRLRAAGIQAEFGLLQAEARALNNAFAKFIQTGLPLVTLKSALSRDGMLAPPASLRKPKRTFWLTGKQAREEVQALRHGVDAVLTGVGTVLADDPLLNDRSGLPRHRRLLRVVMDSHLSTPVMSQLARTANRDVLLFCNHAADPKRQAALEMMGIRIIRSTGTSERPSIAEVLQSLGQLGVTQLLLEAGTRLNGAFLQQGMVDEVVLFHAPITLGPEAVPFAEGQPAPGELEKKILRPTHEKFGDDDCVRGLLRDPWAALDADTPLDLR
jgi:diaminohydroxyphosphoribosylaminopyrimidine deaminase/5-amino-6-(5-phosphoribosylamino)uracil reductase